MATNCDKTIDIFPVTEKRGRGRPATSTPEKKRADNAERQRRHRAKQAVKNQMIALIAAEHTKKMPDRCVIEAAGVMIAHYSGVNLGRLEVWYTDNNKFYASGDFSCSEIERLIADGYSVQFHKFDR